MRSFAANNLSAIREYVFFDLILLGTKVDEQTMFDSCRSQITKDLGNVFVGDRFTGFEFDDENAFDKQVRKVIAKRSTVVIEYRALSRPKS